MRSLLVGFLIVLISYGNMLLPALAEDSFDEISPADKLHMQVDELSKTIALDPDDLRAYVQRAKCYFQLGQYSEAVDDYGAALELDSGDAQAYKGRAAAYEKLGEGQECRRDYMRAAVAGGYQRKASGIYALDDDISFNVLDYVVLDRKANQLSLVGHFDQQYAGAKIPYLEHLANILDNPQPQFSLNWTKESERRVDDLFARLDSPASMQDMARLWGQWFDDSGNVTAAGRIFMPLFGVGPTRNGKGAGYLGAVVEHKPNSGNLLVTEVQSGSPAESAGLQVGDEISLADGNQPFYPSELRRQCRFAGAGASFTLQVFRPGGLVDLTAELGETADDPWQELDRYDVVSRILQASGRKKAADIVDIVGKFRRLMNVDDPFVPQAILASLIFAVGKYERWNEINAQEASGAITHSQAGALLMQATLEGMETAYGLYGSPLTNAFDNARQSGQDNSSSFQSAFSEMDRQLAHQLKESMQEVLRRQDEVHVPLNAILPAAVPVSGQATPDADQDAATVTETVGAQLRGLLDSSGDGDGNSGAKIVVAPEAARAVPEVCPQYIGVDGHSSLARVMYSCDYLGKIIPNLPELAQKFKAYKTLFAYERDHAGSLKELSSTASHHMWLSIESVDAAESKEGNTLAIKNCRVRFNIRQDSGSGAVDSTAGAGYASLLTSLYDDFEREWPSFHELRECAKLAAAAAWLKSKQPDLHLPAAGRSLWSGPEKLPGIVYLTWSPRSSVDDSRIELMATGGVSLVPPVGPSGPVSGQSLPPAAGHPPSQVFPADASVVDLRDCSLTAPARIPDQGSEPLPRLLESLHRKVDIPVPRRYGEVASSTKGERTLQALNAVLDTTDEIQVAQALALQDKIEATRMTAVMLAQCERAINVLDEKNPDRQLQYRKLADKLAKERARFLESAVDIISQGAFDAYTFHTDVLLWRGRLQIFAPDLALPAAFSALMTDTASSLMTVKRSLEGVNSMIQSLKGGIEGNYQDALAILLGLYGDRNVRICLGPAARMRVRILGPLVELVKCWSAIDRMEASGEKEAAALKEKLLPLQRKLSDQLDSQLRELAAGGVPVSPAKTAR